MDACQYKAGILMERENLTSSAKSISHPRRDIWMSVRCSLLNRMKWFGRINSYISLRLNDLAVITTPPNPPHAGLNVVFTGNAFVFVHPLWLCKTRRYLKNLHDIKTGSC